MRGKIDLSGLRKLEQNMRTLSGTQRVALTEILSPAFMRAHTRFSSFENMLEKSPFTVKTAEDFRAIPDAEWEAYVRRSTKFTSWEAMQKQAGAEWVKARLLKGLK